MVRERAEVELTLTDRLSGKLRQAAGGVKKFSTSASRGFNNVAKAAGRMLTSLTGIGAALSGAAVAAMIAGINRLEDSFAKLSTRLGASTQFLSEFTFAAERAGIDANTTALALQRVTRRFGEIQRTGRGTALSSLQDLGDGFVEAVKQGATFEQLLPSIADSLARMEDEGRALSIAFGLLDSEGAKLVQLFREGSVNIDEYMRRARELGISVTPEAAAAAAVFADRVSDLQASLTGLGRVVLGTVRPALTSMIESLTTGITKITSFGTEITSFTSLIARAAGDLAGAIAKDVDEEFSKLGADLQSALLRVFFSEDVAQAFEKAGQKSSKDYTGAFIARTSEDLSKLTREQVLEQFGFDRFVEGFFQLQKRFTQGRQAVDSVSAAVRDLFVALRQGGGTVETYLLQLGNVVDKEMAANRERERAARLLAEQKVQQQALNTEVGRYEARLAKINASQHEMNDALLGAKQGLLDIREEFSLFNQTRNAIRNVAGSISQSFNAALDDVTEGTFKLRNAILGLLNDVRRQLVRAGTNALIGQLVGAIGGALASGIGPSVSGVGSTPSSTGAGGPTSGVVRPVTLQRGGIVTGTGAVPAVLHPPEAVIPLDKGGGGLGGDTFIVNVHAVDAQSFSKLLRSGATKDEDFFGNLFASQFRNRPGIRSAMAER